MAIGTTIPVIVIEKMTPLVLKNMDKLQDLGLSLILKCNNLPLDIKCTDPRITYIKKLLETIKNFIASIKKLIAAIKKVIKALKTIKAAATTIKLVQMVFPLPPFTPPGPIAELLGIVNKLLQNLKSAMPCFLAMIDIIKLTVADMNNIMAMALMTLGGICTNEIFEATPDVTTLINDRTTNTSTNATSVNNNGDSLITQTSNSTYDPSIVSDDDLSDYLDLLNGIANELEDPTKAGTFLEEAPSLVYSGTGAPDQSIGKLGDYYVDLSNSTIFGPKVTDVAWS
jgi:hypothetical protein